MVRRKIATVNENAVFDVASGDVTIVGSGSAVITFPNYTSTLATTDDISLTALGVTSTASELNVLDGITATTAELNYTDGVTSNIQTQLNGKQATITNSTSNTISGTQIQRAALTGDVTASANSNATTIANNVVSNDKLADMATSTIKGRVTAGTGDPQDLTAAQVRTIINVADGATANDTDANLKNRANHTGTQAHTTITGLGTLATKSDVANDGKQYVRKDGAWEEATGGGTPGGSDTQVQFNNSGVFGGESTFVYQKPTGLSKGVLKLGTGASDPNGVYDGAISISGYAGPLLQSQTTTIIAGQRGTGSNYSYVLQLPNSNGIIATEENIDGTRSDRGSSGTSKTFNWDNGRRQYMTMTGNCTVTFSNPVAGRTYVLELTQDATGSRTITRPSTVKTPGGAGAVLSTTANAKDVVTLYYDGTNYLTHIAKAYA